MEVDPETGFLTPANYHAKTGVTPEVKLTFLEVYRQTRNFSEAARVCGFSRVHFHHLRSIDSVFDAAVREIQEEVSDRLESVMAINAEKPSGFMDRIAWLRAHRPEKYGDKKQVTYSVDASMIQALSESAKLYAPAPAVPPLPSVEVKLSDDAE